VHDLLAFDIPSTDNDVEIKIVLATVPGYPAPVRGWNWTGWYSSGCYPENRGTHQVRGQVGTGPRFHCTVRTILTPIRYLNSDCIATWSSCEICRLMPYFLSRSQICDRNNIHWVTLKWSRKSCQNGRVSIPTPPKLVRSQLRQREMKEGIKLHIIRIDYVSIRWELWYLIGARNVALWRSNYGWKSVETVRFRLRTGPWTEPWLWTRC
jgi:hypothetical protein